MFYFGDEIAKLVAGDGFEPPTSGYEPDDLPLLYPATIKSHLGTNPNIEKIFFNLSPSSRT